MSNYNYNRISTEPDYEGAGSEKVKRVVETLIRGTDGKVLEAVMYPPEKGGGYSVVLSSEWAALRCWYHHKDNKKANLDKTPKGWVFSVRK